jgi:hypothetical protein
MVTKANRTKAAERIQKAKKKYKVAEDKTDSLLMRLIDIKYTLPIVLVACGVVIWLAL